MPVPLETLACTIDSTGISAPAIEDIIGTLVANFQGIYGSDAYLQPDGQDYQLIAIVANAINDQNQVMVAAYNGMSPSTAQGAALSSLVKINGLQRQSPTNSTAIVTITGTFGTFVINGVVRDANNNLWDIPNVAIPFSGSIDVTATAQVQGAIAAPASTINIIDTPILGWQTANNAASALPGAPVETDAALRRRQAASTTLSSRTPPLAISAALANLAGVQRSIVYENNTNAADANGIPAHSIAAVVQGGDLTRIATTIEEKKSPGTGTAGTTTIVVNDPGGLPIAINFYVLAITDIFMTVTIHPLNGYNSGMNAQIQQALFAFLNSLPIGDSVFYNWLFAPATLNGNIAFRVTVLTVGIAANPVGTVDVAVPFNKAAICSSLNNIVISVA